VTARLHPETVLATRLQARRQVIGLERLQPLGAIEVETDLFIRVRLHADQSGVEQRVCGPQKVSIWSTK